MKVRISLFCICLLFVSCGGEKETEAEPSYTAKIAWDSGLVSNDYHSHTVAGDSVYFYERPPEYDTVNIYTLTRLDAKTGELIWRSVMFTDIIPCQPIVIDNYAYVFFEHNIIACLDTETGKQIATVAVDDGSKNLEFSWNPAVYNNYLFTGTWSDKVSYFIRLDLNEINYFEEPGTIQIVCPEIFWETETGFFEIKPMVHKNIVYISTYNPVANRPVELTGFNIDTKERVFYQTFGGSEDGNIPFPETGGTKNPIFIYKDTLYYLNWSISAWDIKTGEQLYHHVFGLDIPEPKTYYANEIIDAVYHQGKIYYTSLDNYEPNRHRNIHCINAKTGELVWNNIAKYSLTLHTNPIIAHDRLYIGQSSGLRVYEPKTGKLIGVDKSFSGADMGRNVLYNDYMICVRYDENDDGILVAVDVGE